jgi:DNA-binding MarR family transcriptional regulator
VERFSRTLRTQATAAVPAAVRGGPVAALSRLHLVVLAFAYYERAETVADIADALGLDCDEVERVCAELASAGYLAWESYS